MPDAHALNAALNDELRKTFPVAFLGRLNIIPYLPLSQENLQAIVKLQLQKVVNRMQQQHGIVLHCSEAAVTHIAELCGTHDTGARHIAQFIEQSVLTQLANLWLQAMQEKVQMQELALDIKQVASNVLPASMVLPGRNGLFVNVISIALIQS